MAGQALTIPNRGEVSESDCWDLSDLYSDDDAWEGDFTILKERLSELVAYKGTLDSGAGNLRAFLDLDIELDRILDKLYQYAQRRGDQDLSNSHYKGLCDRVSRLWSEASEATAFFRSELLALSDDQLQSYLDSDELSDFRFNLEQIIRMKPYTLSEGEERLLAMSSEIARAPHEIFEQLNDTDLDFGFITDSDGNRVEVSQGSYSVYLSKPDRSVRKTFFETFYKEYIAHKHTLAAAMAAGVKKNTFYSRARGFKSAREAALFRIQVPETVYDSLIEAAHNHLPTLYRYFELRKRVMGLDEIHFYDTMVPMLSDQKLTHSYDQGVDRVLASVEPLGSRYVEALAKGLRGGWVDRYENRGKRSGAYSASCYDAHPCILLNYKSEDLNHVYTLTHEAGHAMHSWHSHQHQPPQLSNYVIFVAEVASTFNEVLLTQHLLDNSSDPRMKAYIINRELDMIRSTIFRQTMFAEFEHLLHAHAEAGKPLSIADMSGIYSGLLNQYFGPGFTLDDQLNYEFLRVPHFYFNFYVFQYATGLSAAYALARRVMEGGQQEVTDYLNFLSAGGSKYPIDLLKDAGVDMTTSEPVESALTHFGHRVTELEELLAAQS